MYSLQIAAPAAAVGFGPLRLAFERQPLAVGDVERLVGRRCSARAVGYQPVGMKPSGLAFARSATLNTARLLASALATKSICAVGRQAQAVGRVAVGAFG